MERRVKSMYHLLRDAKSNFIIISSHENLENDKNYTIIYCIFSFNAVGFDRSAMEATS